MTVDVLSSGDPFQVSERLEVVINPSNPDPNVQSEVPVIISVTDSVESKNISVQVYFLSSY